MLRAVEILPSARSELKSLPSKLLTEAIAAIEALADDPFPPDAVKLRGHNDYYRLRIASYRIVYRVRPRRILITRVASRANVYRGL
jgi:mRNA interferase RelE/StbE